MEKELKKSKSDDLKEEIIKPIARIYSDFPEKFGIPRQSGLINTLHSKIIFEPMYRDEMAFKGITDFTYLWLIWKFSEVKMDKWSPTVRPPRLGGNKRVGVFATRSPFRPNTMGLSSVKLDKFYIDKKVGPVIEVLGADIMNGTPIYDIKPYIPYTDCHVDAVGGFADEVYSLKLNVNMDLKFQNILSYENRESLIKILENDPRPHYQNDKNRIYSFEFSNYNIKFKVENSTLTVVDLTQIDQ